MDEMDEKKINESYKIIRKNLEKVKDLEMRLLEEVLSYSLKAYLREDNFDNMVKAIVDAFSKCLSSVVTSSAIAQEMDREKFSIHLDDMTTRIKQIAHKDFDALLKEIKGKDEGSNDI